MEQMRQDDMTRKQQHQKSNSNDCLQRKNTRRTSNEIFQAHYKGHRLGSQFSNCKNIHKLIPRC